MKARREIGIRISADALLPLFRGEVRLDDQEIPADAEIVRYAAELETNSILLVLSHPTFGEIGEGFMLPLRRPFFRRVKPMDVEDPTWTDQEV